MGLHIIKNMETIKHIFKVDRREINYLKITIESYDGISVVRTIDPYEALIELQISPGCEILVLELLNALVEQESIQISAYIE